MNSAEFRPKIRNNHSYIAIQSIIHLDDTTGIKYYFPKIQSLEDSLIILMKRS